MNIQRWLFDLNNFKLARAIAIGAIALMGSATMPLSAQVVRVESRGFGAGDPTLGNNSIIYTNPISSPINSSIVYGSPIPSPVITYPSNFYPSYYPNPVSRTTLTSPVLVNPTIRDSTLINPTIIIQPQRRDRVIERNTTILRPINY